MSSRDAVTLVPDAFDPRDLLYRPEIRLLPAVVRPHEYPAIRTQEGDECVGHALANMIEVAFLRRRRSVRVSPQMLHRLATRYDDSDSDLTSLRAGLKGWYHHGLLAEARWAALAGSDAEGGADRGPDLDDPKVRRECARLPLGAYYRVNPLRLDDVQSAISELGAVAAAAVCHDGWSIEKLKGRGRGGSVIAGRSGNGERRHAFAVIGYDALGFLVLNSEGEQWGAGGCAWLPYEDWLLNVFDAWVARPGVPSTPSSPGRDRRGRGTFGGQIADQAPNLDRLRSRVISLGSNGVLSRNGRYVSPLSQLGFIGEALAASQGKKATPVVLWFHDGLRDDVDQRWLTTRILDAWGGEVHALFVAWPGGGFRVLLAELGDRVSFSDHGPARVERDQRPHADRLVEIMVSRDLRAAWNELKSLAEMGGDDAMTTVAELLSEHDVDLSVVAEGTGCYLATTFVSHLSQLTRSSCRPAHLILLSPTLTVGELEAENGSNLRGRWTGEIVVHCLAETTEEVAETRSRDTMIHSRSFLSIVARALERGTGAEEARIAGLARVPVPQGDPFTRLEAPGAHSNARTHAGFAEDPLTLQSILDRVRGTSSPGRS